MLQILTPAATQSLTTLAAVKRELGISGTAEDTHLTALIAQASTICAAWCGRPGGFGRASLRQTERLTAWRPVLVLDWDLSPAVSAVTVDTAAVTDYELDGSLLYRLSGRFRTQWSPWTVVEVTYSAGFDLAVAVPADLERAALVLVTALYAARGRDPGLRSESVDGVTSASYLDPRPGMEGLPPGAAGLLAPYRALGA